MFFIFSGVLFGYFAGFFYRDTISSYTPITKTDRFFAEVLMPILSIIFLFLGIFLNI
jgi:hypothetical protein